MYIIEIFNLSNISIKSAWSIYAGLDPKDVHVPTFYKCKLFYMSLKRSFKIWCNDDKDLYNMYFAEKIIGFIIKPDIN